MSQGILINGRKVMAAWMIHCESKWANEPHLTIGMAGDIWDGWSTAGTWRKSDDYYWMQSPCGLTRFHTHNGKLIEQDGKLVTSTKHEGYGGSHFEFPCIIDGEIRQVVLRGPWSGNSMTANQYLPKPVIEVSFYGNQSCGMGGVSLTVEAARRVLAKYLRGWTIDGAVGKAPWSRDLSVEQSTIVGGHTQHFTFKYRGKSKREHLASDMDRLADHFREFSHPWTNPFRRNRGAA